MLTPPYPFPPGNRPRYGKANFKSGNQRFVQDNLVLSSLLGSSPLRHEKLHYLHMTVVLSETQWHAPELRRAAPRQHPPPAPHAGPAHVRPLVFEAL